MLKPSHIILLFSIAVGLIDCQSDDGYTNLEIKRKLKLHESPITIQNRNYPSEAPARLKQTWIFTSYPWIRIQLTCDQIKISENEPCEKSYIEVNDGTNINKYCGEITNLAVASVSNKLEIIFKTDQYTGGGLFSCEVVGFNPEFTTLKPPSTTESYLKMKSIEVDSSEHGVKPGNKSTTCECGRTNKLPARIVGGTIATPNEYPFMAALASKEVGIPFCGATIITSYHAITAAHCTIKLIEYNVDGVLLVAEHDYSADSKVADVYNVKQILQHEQYNKEEILNDIALVLLDRKIAFNSFVGKACLPARRMDLSHQPVTMLGWGRTSFLEKTSTVLRKVKARIIPTRDCTDVWSLFIPDNDPKQLCTYAKGKTTCKGDSGGPVLWVDPETNRYTIVGLTSFGLNCSPNIPSVKTEVAGYLDWIERQVGRSTPGGRSDICTKRE